MQITFTRRDTCVKAKGGHFEHNLSWICWKLTWTHAADVANFWLRPTMNNVFYSEKSVQQTVASNVLIYRPMASIRWTLSAFHKACTVLHFTDEVDAFIIIWYDVSWNYVYQKLLKSVHFSLSYLKKSRCHRFIRNTVYFATSET